MTAGRVVSPDLSPEREKTLTKGRAAMVKVGFEYRFELITKERMDRALLQKAQEYCYLYSALEKCFLVI